MTATEKSARNRMSCNHYFVNCYTPNLYSIFYFANDGVRTRTKSKLVYTLVNDQSIMRSLGLVSWVQNVINNTVKT
jgi:hypothetical protein